jgi:hypothetical protein
MFQPWAGKHAAAFNEDIGVETRADVLIKGGLFSAVFNGRVGGVFGSGSAFAVAHLPADGRFAYYDYFGGLQFSTCILAGVSRVGSGPAAARRMGTQFAVSFMPCDLGHLNPGD